MCGSVIQGWSEAVVLLSSQMEQIKRANRMYTNDSIHLKKSLSIPLLLDCPSGLGSPPDPGGDDAEARSARKQEDGGGGTSEELSPEEFLKRLDGLIHQSKQAAARGCREADKRLVLHVSSLGLWTLRA